MENSNFRNNLLKCFHNDIGYCKHRDQCWHRHFSNICQEQSCVRQYCKARHPRRCRDGESCRFFRKNVCAFLHEELEVANEEHNTKMHEMENELESLKILNDKLRKENEVLTKEIKSNIIEAKELEAIKINIFNSKNENHELGEEMVKAKNEVKTMKAEIICKNKENNVLKESIEKVKDDLVKEFESHKMTKKTIAELEVQAKQTEQRLKKYSATIMVLLEEKQDFKLTVKK